jgi:hypothetical protein
MKNLLRCAALTGVFAGFAFAASYNGHLLDAACVDQNKSKNCDPTSNSTAFVLVVEGKTMRLDDAGNAKAVEALKSRSDRRRDPNTPTSSAVTAKVTGTMEGDVLRVDMIEVQ